MKYLLCTFLALAGFGTAGAAFYYPPHALTLTPALFAISCIAMCFYLFDPTGFLTFSADARKSATSWFKKGDA